MLLDILMWIFTVICCIGLAAFVLFIHFVNKNAHLDIATGSATIKDFDVIFIPIGICWITVWIKKK